VKFFAWLLRHAPTSSYTAEAARRALCKQAIKALAAVKEFHMANQHQCKVHAPHGAVGDASTPGESVPCAA